MYKKVKIIILVCIGCFGLNCIAQKKIIKPELSNNNQLQLVNREAIIFTNKQGEAIIHLNSKPNDGIAWIKNATFEKGVIEFDVKGKNIVQQSFVGVAFHGINDSTFEAVYFRPFNFLSTDTMRKKHSVQYISLPNYDWSLLRQQYPGKFENALLNPPDPESWFHARVEVDADNIRVYVNDDTKPSFIVKPISHQTTGKIGFWVGNNSDGDFSNLAIKTDR